MNLSVTPKKSILIFSIILASLGLSACSDNDDTDSIISPNPEDKLTNNIQQYNVTVTNLTAAQPMSPLTLVIHEANTQLWQQGQPSSLAIEKIAESGDNSDLLALASIKDNMTSKNILLPGESDTLTLTLADTNAQTISLVTMLVNTNDAFTGFSDITLKHLSLNETMEWQTVVYDAGTEANSEEKGTIPGPVDNGEGFNITRDDLNRVHLHSGVISLDDGLVDSVLSAYHRFDNPSLNIKIQRIQ
ncbi:spondin domain-containing protein [uncultured Shewanella sp.]|uniref:spondin domain-containing protein n=1 Tax=uncultured Shewanella sp. TaxID=173975 RepID=UPI00261A1CDE|nr:spondin domain-containing protein [uncultured Shewanella sp.]